MSAPKKFKFTIAVDGMPRDSWSDLEEDLPDVEVEQREIVAPFPTQLYFKDIEVKRQVEESDQELYDWFATFIPPREDAEGEPWPDPKPEAECTCDPLDLNDHPKLELVESFYDDQERLNFRIRCPKCECEWVCHNCWLKGYRVEDGCEGEIEALSPIPVQIFRPREET